MAIYCFAVTMSSNVSEMTYCVSSGTLNLTLSTYNEYKICSAPLSFYRPDAFPAAQPTASKQ